MEGEMLQQKKKSSLGALGSLEEVCEVEDMPSPPRPRQGRRMSWHIGVSKPEKRRKKQAVAALSPPAMPPLVPRKRAGSWWASFIPDLRSRRPSQEAQPNPTGRRASEFHTHQPFRTRNKSLSVDHGTTSPLKLKSSTLDKLSRGDGDGDATGSRESLGRMQPAIPTTTYKVEASDTLNSVAARFDTTPSELAKLNRLNSRTVFPGQVIRVPDKKAIQGGQPEGPQGDQPIDQEPLPATPPPQPPQEQEILETLHVSSPKPATAATAATAQVERSSSGTPTRSSGVEKFLKINVRHITDGQGVVGGVLLVTPNAIMFDPNVSDPLVIDRGPESYGVIAPMEYVVNIAIYHDIAHMRVGSAHSKSNIPKPEVYHIKCEESEVDSDHQPDSMDSKQATKDDTLPDHSRCSGEEDEMGDWCCPREGSTKTCDSDLVTPSNITSDKLSDTTQESACCDEKSLTEDTSAGVEDGEALVRALETRRRSCLDHHWAKPSNSVDTDKSEHSIPEQGEESRGEEGTGLVKHSCHDSGIDIRDEVPLAPLPKKTSYSDADVLLAGDGEFVPPIPVQPLPPAVEEEKKKQSVSFSLDDEKKEPESEKQDKKKNYMLKRLSYPLAWMEGITGSEDKDSLPSSADSHPSQSSSVFSKVFSRRPSVGTFIRQQHPQYKTAGPKLDYRSMVSVEDMPELFVSFDKLIPRPARSCEDPPLYLRLRMGKPKNKKIPKSTPIMSYGKKKMRPEYWFSVPRERVDDLYKFLMAWVGSLYGDLDEDLVSSRGYELVDSDTELWESGDDMPSNRRSSDPDAPLSDLTRESWEVLSMSGELRRALYANSAPSLDLEPFLPDLVGNTEILTEEHRKSLCRHLPARAEGYVWTLVFSTSQHGFSLNSMYRKMTKIESPILMVIQDTDNNVFGALTSCSLKVSDHFYGTGESLLFRFAPECQAYNWTGDNMYFIKGNNESLSIGAGDGKFGLWLDGDLYQGRSESCSTYANEPLSPQQDFVVKTLECWAFV